MPDKVDTRTEPERMTGFFLVRMRLLALLANRCHDSRLRRKLHCELTMAAVETLEGH